MSSIQQKTIVCDEIFDANFTPTEKDILDYAVKIGIDPVTEKHLLSIAKDGLMQPLPKEWKPCLVDGAGCFYYYNSRTGESQWNHPLDAHYKNMVKKGRSEGYSSAGEEDSKTTIKEDLKSCEEVVDFSENIFSLSHPSSQSGIIEKNSSPKSKENSPDKMKAFNPTGRPPLPPKRGINLAFKVGMSPQRYHDSESQSLNLKLTPSSKDPQLKSSPSPTKIDIDSLSLFTLPSSQPNLDSIQKPVASKGLKIKGGGSMFLKSNQKLSPSPTEEIKLPVHSKLNFLKEPEGLYSLDRKTNIDREISNEKQEILPTTKLEKPVKHIKAKEQINENIHLKDEEKMLLRNQELEEEQRRSVRFADFDKKALDLDIRFHVSDSEDSGTSENNGFDDMNIEVKEKMIQNDQINIGQGDVLIKLKKNENNMMPPLKYAKERFVNQNQIENKETYLFPDNKSGDLNTMLLTKEDLNKLTDHNLKVNQTDSDSVTNKTFHNNNIRKNLFSDYEGGEVMQCVKSKNNRIQNDNDITRNINNGKSLDYGIVSGANTISFPKQSDVTKTNVLKSSLDNLLNDNFDVKEHTLTNEEIESKYSLIKNNVSDSNVLAGDKFDDQNSLSTQSTSNSTEHLDRDDGLKKKITKSKHMPEVDLKKVFENMREVLLNSSEHSEVEDENNADMEELISQNMNLTFEDGSDYLISKMLLNNHANENSFKNTSKGENAVENFELEIDDLKRLKETEMREVEIIKEKIFKLRQEQEIKLSEIIKEATEEESFQKQRILKEMQNNIERFKVEIEKETQDKKIEIRNHMESKLKSYKEQLDKERADKENELRVKYEAFVEEEEKRIKKEEKEIEEETNKRVQSNTNILTKLVEDIKAKEEVEKLRLESECEERLKNLLIKAEQLQAEHEEQYKKKLALVDAELEHVLAERKTQLETALAEQETVIQEELAAAKEQHDAAIHKAQEQQQARFEQFWTQSQQEEEFMKKKHAEKMEELTSQLKTSEKEDLNREFEKIRCEKRLLEDKYRTLKDKYIKLKSDVRLSMERKRQAKLNRQLQQREGTSTAEETTEKSTDCSKPPTGRNFNKKLPPQIEEPIAENGVSGSKTVKRKTQINKSPISVTTTSSLTGESCPSSSGLAPDLPVPPKPKNVWCPSPLQRREGVMETDNSSADDNHTSVSEDITGCSLSEQDPSMGKWEKRKATFKILSSNPIDSLRKQLEKLEELEEQFPPSTHIDTYLRYPFSGPAGASSELEFYRHRLHLERESVRRAKQALAEQKIGLENRQIQLRSKQANSSLQQLQQEERELTDLEVNLHRTKSLLGEKIIRLRHLEQSLERATPPPSVVDNHSPNNTFSETLGATDSSGFSGSDLDISTTHLPRGGIQKDIFKSDISFNVLQSLENINSEIREIWAILGKQQIPGKGLGSPPLLQYTDANRPNPNQVIDYSQRYQLAPRHANDIAERARGLREWLVQARNHHDSPTTQVT
uniref:WW domain-containing protein n=1 Tax=Clastoptera arizonana TaxID=38151 RepID=A0A1B6CN76_9HEMI